MKLSHLFKSRDKPKNLTAGQSFRFHAGISSSGKKVNEISAMQITGVYACVRVLAESIAGLPLHLFQEDKDGNTHKALDHPLFFLLHSEPNSEMTSFNFKEMKLE